MENDSSQKIERWLIDPDRLPATLRYAFNAALAIVAIWFVFQSGYWLAFGIVNDGPFPGIALAAGYVAIASWGVAIAIRWGYSLVCKS